jgi:hypothetical protein
MGVIKYISSLIELLSIPCRVSYVPVLRDILLAASPYNWRLRQMIASQFKALVVLLPTQNLYATLFPLAITLIQDRIAEVRSSILPGIAKMITVVLPGYQPTFLLDEYAPDGTVISVQPPPISDDATYLEAIVVAINALVVSDAYIYRQIWCELAVELLVELPPAIFEKYFLSGLLRLASDPIANVRVKVAESLTQWRKYDLPDPWEGAEEVKMADIDQPQPHSHPWRWLLSREEVHECVQRLSRDDRDVFNRVRKLQPLFPEIEFLEISCRGMKVSPGGTASHQQIPITQLPLDMSVLSSSDEEERSHTPEAEVENEELLLSSGGQKEAYSAPPLADNLGPAEEQHGPELDAVSAMLAPHVTPVDPISSEEEAGDQMVAILSEELESPKLTPSSEPSQEEESNEDLSHILQHEDGADRGATRGEVSVQLSEIIANIEDADSSSS